MFEGHVAKTSLDKSNILYIREKRGESSNNFIFPNLIASIVLFWKELFL